MEGKVKDLSIALLGNPAMTAGQIKEILNLDSETYTILALTRGVTHIYKFNKLDLIDNTQFRINLLLERDGRELEVMRFINNVIEDEISNIIDGVGINALEILDNCISTMNNLFKVKVDDKSNIYYRSFENKLRNVMVTGEMLEEFKEGEYSLDLDKAYLMQSVDKLNNVKGGMRETLLLKNFIKIYNLWFSCLKYYMTLGISNVLGTGGSNTSSKNNCITIEGSLDSIEGLYEHVSNTITNFGIIANLIDTMEISFPPTETPESIKLDNLEKIDSLTLVLPNLKQSSTRYLETVITTNYKLYFDTLENYKNFSRMFDDRLSSLDGILDKASTKYILGIEDKIDDSAVRELLTISNDLSISEDLPVMFDFIGDLDNAEYDYQELKMEFSHNQLNEHAESLLDFPTEQEADEGVDIYKSNDNPTESRMGAISRMTLVGEIARVGTNGLNPVKRDIIGWGTKAKDYKIEKTSEDKPVLRVENFDIEFEVVDNLNVLENAVSLEDIVNTVVLQDTIHQENIDILSETDITQSMVKGELSLIDDIFVHLKRYYQETVAQLDNPRKIKRLYSKLMLGESDSNDMEEIMKVINNFNTNSTLITDNDNYSGSTRLRQLIVRHIIDVIYSEARRYRLNQVANNSVRATRDNIDNVVDSIFE